MTLLDQLIENRSFTQKDLSLLIDRIEVSETGDANSFIYMEPYKPGGMPEMVFEYILKQKGLDPAADLSIDQSIDFGSTAAAFSGGTGDFTVEFEPGATSLEKEGKGYVVASLGVESGYVPYTAYSARGSYLKENEKIVQSFVNALKKGMEYVNTHTPEEIAKTIQPQFKGETDLGRNHPYRPPLRRTERPGRRI